MVAMYLRLGCYQPSHHLINHSDRKSKDKQKAKMDVVKRIMCITLRQLQDCLEAKRTPESKMLAKDPQNNL